MINKVILLGNVGNNPDIKTLESGTKAARISLATSYSWKDKDGNWQEKTEWHNVIAFGAICDSIIAKISKGEKLYIEGRLQTREYIKDDEKRYATDVVLDIIKRLNPPKSDDHRMPTDAPPDKWTHPRTDATPGVSSTPGVSMPGVSSPISSGSSTPMPKEHSVSDLFEGPSTDLFNDELPF